jgi:hypothetical protein
MTLRNGKEFLMIPGPTNVPEEVLRAMHRPAVDIYEGPLLETTRFCLHGLQRLFRTEGKTYIYAANGHGAWDAALCNTLKRGDRVLVLESGRFAVGWGEAANVLDLQIEILPGAWDRGVDPSKPFWWFRSIRRPASGTISLPCARPSMPPGTLHFSWSIPSRRSAACRLKWMPGASMWR